MKNIFLLSLCLSAKMLIAQSVVFRTSVDKLRLREAPNIESKIIKTVEKGTELFWLDVRSEQNATTDWKGGKATDYWYKVKSQSDSAAWVFGKGIELGFINFTISINSPWKPINYDNPWLNIAISNEEAFLKLEKTKPYSIKPPSKNYKKDSIITLLLNNGKNKIFIDKKPKDDYEFKVFNVVGEIPEINHFLVYFEIFEYWSSIFINKNNGIESHISTIGSFLNDKENSLHFSKNKKMLVAPYQYDYSGYNGLVFLPFSTETNHCIEVLNIGTCDEFRFINDNSGIAKMQDNIFLKITIK